MGVRKKKKLNITALTKIMGVTSQTIRGAIKDKRDLRLSTFVKFIQALDGEFSIINTERKTEFATTEAEVKSEVSTVATESKTEFSIINTGGKNVTITINC